MRFKVRCWQAEFFMQHLKPASCPVWTRNDSLRQDVVRGGGSGNSINHRVEAEQPEEIRGKMFPSLTENTWLESKNLFRAFQGYPAMRIFLSVFLSFFFSFFSFFPPQPHLSSHLTLSTSPSTLLSPAVPCVSVQVFQLPGVKSEEARVGWASLHSAIELMVPHSPPTLLIRPALNNRKKKQRSGSRFPPKCYSQIPHCVLLRRLHEYVYQPLVSLFDQVVLSHAAVCVVSTWGNEHPGGPLWASIVSV